MLRKQKTFTLIELILVVAIVAILAGVMIPVITSARQKARAAKFVQLVDTLATACRLYNADTGGYAFENSVTAPTSVWSRGLTTRPHPTVASGWDGPYISKPLTNDDISPASAIWVRETLLVSFDLDGDSTLDKFIGRDGNCIIVWQISESDAKAINDVMDKNVPGDWMGTGNINFQPSPVGLGRATIYLIGGSL